MIGSNFRPWGQLDWLLSKLPNVKWDLLACLSYEDRYDATMLNLKQKDLLNRSLFLKILDPPSKDTQKIIDKLVVNQSKLNALDNLVHEIEEHQLLEPYSKIVESLNNFLKSSSGNVVLDIST